MNPPEPQVFDDPGPELSRGPLTLFIACSIAVHLIGFALLQVVYPPAIAKFPGDARLVLLTPNTSDPAFLSWVQSNDPADVLHARRGSERDDSLLGYVPSFNTSQLPLRPGRRPVETAEIALTRRVLPEAQTSSTWPIADRPEAPVVSAITALARPEGTLAALLGQAEIPLGKVAESTLRPARFGYAWRSPGVAPLVFVLTSTGNEAVDADILARLREVHPPDSRASGTGELTVVFVNRAPKETP